MNVNYMEIVGKQTSYRAFHFKSSFQSADVRRDSPSLPPSPTGAEGKGGLLGSAQTTVGKQ